MTYRLTPKNLKESNRKDEEEHLELGKDALALRMGGKNLEFPYSAIDRLEIFTKRETGFVDSISVYLKREACKGEFPPEGQGWEKAGRGRVFLILVGFQAMEQIASELQKRLKDRTPVEIKQLLRTEKEAQRLLFLLQLAVVLLVALFVGVLFFITR